MSDDTKPVRKPREQLSLKLSPQITGAVRILAEQYRKTQAHVLDDLAAGCEGMMLTRLEGLAGKYAHERDKEIAFALGRNTPGPSVADVLALQGGLSAGLSPDTSMEPSPLAGPGLAGSDTVDFKRDWNIELQPRAAAAVLTRSPADDLPTKEEIAGHVQEALAMADADPGEYLPIDSETPS